MPLEKTAGPWRVIGAALTMTCLFGTACAVPGGEPDTYPPRNMEEEYVVQTVETMIDAMNQKDVPRLMGKVSTGYYRGYDRLENSLSEDLPGMDELIVMGTIGDIAMEEPRVTVSLLWKGRWSGGPSGGINEIEGRTSLIFMKGMGIKLIDFKGDPLPGF